MSKLRSNFTVMLAMLTFALLACQFSAFAQEGNRRPAATASDAGLDASNLDEVAVAPGDVDSLIDNLSGGVGKVLRVRVFSAGDVVEYAAAFLSHHSFEKVHCQSPPRPRRAMPPPAKNSYHGRTLMSPSGASHRVFEMGISLVIIQAITIYERSGCCSFQECWGIRRRPQPPKNEAWRRG
jgi:hypothetical protein